MKRRLFVITGVLLCSLTTQAHAMETDYYYDGLKPNNLQTGYERAKSYSNSTTIMKLQGNDSKSRYKAVGYISNKNGWAGEGEESMGTGFVIDDYTVLTNAHVIGDKNGNKVQAKYIRFMMNRDGKKIPYNFEVKDIVKIPSADLAVLHTKNRLTAYVKPLKLATDWQINQLRPGTPLYSVGYPYHGTDDYTTRYWNQAVFLGRSSNITELMTKDRFRAGASGSPLVDANFNVYGVRTYSHKLYNVNDDKYGRVELAGAESLYGYSGAKVLQYSY
ncbi:S1 family peptidase [Macrococcus equipercicus]|uniref:Serine protease n=1 Tax=Macrococcus equipercicus TaxID=69967 RepID=A0A9Q9BN60_9STAP|nr:serine protease [Macrococcus equipercicus]UTH14210.1 trypsin-like peptidase domain-containing protein [Macrococcus equipercicus]